MDTLAALRAFVRAVDLGSFSRAAAEAGIKVSTVSRYVAALEADLGAALLNRSTRQLHPTEIGAAFHARAATMLAELDDARADARSFNQHPQGSLRLNLPPAFARRHIIPHLPDFLAAHAGIRVHLTLARETIDLIEAGDDLAIRIGALSNSSLVARRLAPQRRLLVASPTWRAAGSELLQPNDLASVDCITATPREVWHHRTPGEPASVGLAVGGRLSTGDSEAHLAAAIAGLGVACLPTWLAADSVRAGQLVPVLRGWHWATAPGDEPSIWGVYPPKKIVAPKVRTFLDFIARRFGRRPYWDDAPPG